MLPMLRCAVASPSALMNRLARSATVTARASTAGPRRAAVATQYRSLSTGDGEGVNSDKPAFGIIRERQGPWGKPMLPRSAAKPVPSSAKSEGAARPPQDKAVPPLLDVRNEIAGRPRERRKGAVGPAVDGILKSVEYVERDNELNLRFQGVGGTASVSTLWLRDSCTCPKCVTPSSGQKTFHTHELPRFPKVQSAEVVTNPENGRTSLRVVWGSAQKMGSTQGSSTEDSATATTDVAVETHESVYDSQELLYKLARFTPPNYPGYLPRRLWDRPTIEKALKPVSYGDWMAADDGNNAEFYRALLDLHELGILIVDGVPDSETAVREIANQIGNIQNTFYGELFDVVSKPNAENVAYTNVFLCLHQDLLYMNDPPFIQLLHCLRNDCDGGESLFSDSVRAAVEMQVYDRNRARALAEFPVSYHYERNGHYYYNSRPVLELEDDSSRQSVSEDSAVRSPNPAQAPVKFTAWSPPFQDNMMHSVARPAEHTPKYGLGTTGSDKDYRAGFVEGRQSARLAYWHSAALEFSQRLEDPNAMLELKLQPGQCVLFNNRRVLHGRRQFNTSDGTRWLKGTYIDEQTFQSRLTDMVRRGRMPGQQTTETETKARPRGQPPFGPFPPLDSERVKSEKEQVVAMIEAAGRSRTPKVA